MTRQLAGIDGLLADLHRGAGIWQVGTGDTARSVAVKAEQAGPLIALATPGWPCRSRTRRGQFSG